ncbi:MAG: 4Fe-4S dicluster domain-containing protein [Paracoccaceae bacterium]
MLNAGIGCQVCTDSCPERALLFDLSVRPVGAIRVQAENCTGCGGCVASCPSNAISIQMPPKVAEPEYAHG